MEQHKWFTKLLGYDYEIVYKKYFWRCSYLCYDVLSFTLAVVNCGF
jgi:hypothetical protein